MAPVIAPTAGDIVPSLPRKRQRTDNSPMAAYATSAKPSAPLAIFASKASAPPTSVPAPVPTQIPAIIGHRRCHNGYTGDPDSSCQTFVKSEGTISKAAACTGVITRLSSATATVGSPMPVTPLTIPASRNTTVM